MKTRKLLTIAGVLALLGGCSTVGPGLANHPGDCAIGVPWADCLPGTRGYANGGGSMHREAAQKQNDAIADQIKAALAQCTAELQTPELDPIRHKVEFIRELDAAPPFEVASLDAFPTAEERPLIAKWATIRDGCVKRAHAISIVPPNATPLAAAFLRQERAFITEGEARLSELIVALYQMKLTYGEFAQRRYEIGKAAAAAQRQYRETMLIDDQQRQIQAQQAANAQFNNNLTAWATYMQAVNARQPQTVRLDSIHCTSNKMGNFVNTNCY